MEGEAGTGREGEGVQKCTTPRPQLNARWALDTYRGGGGGET